MATTAISALALIFLACSKISDDGVTEKSAQQKPASCAGCDFTAVLTQSEIDGLLHMREEEKMARDIYLAFYDLYKKPVFKNIASSEQKHMDAVLFLINGYGLKDPAEGKEVGEFTDAFQSLYNDLLAKGTTITSAYEVGVIIEETDIDDLSGLLAATTVPNLVRVYSNLLTASQTHLATFKSKL